MQKSKPQWRERHGLEKDPATLVRSAFAAAEAGERAPSANPYRNLASALATVPKADRKAAQNLCLAAVGVGLTETEWVPRLLAALSWRKRWRRRPEEWVFHARGTPERRFSALLRWLFVDYPVPRSFDDPFLRCPAGGGEPSPKDPRQRWLIDLGQGCSLRDLDGLPFPVTTRMAHEILRAPNDLGLFGAFRWGQLVGLGTRPDLAAAIATSPIARPLSEEAEGFWAEVWPHLVRAAFLSAREVPALLDYLRFARFGERGPARELRFEAPLTPPFTWGRRSLRTILRQSEAWWASERKRPRRDYDWPEQGLPGVQPEGRFVELLDSSALRQEGEALRHCIATYDFSCWKGSGVVLSFRPMSGARDDRLTLHVRWPERQLKS
ncbi:MAG: hypothetical protein AAFZ18_23085 [Myxococcota bacterium]